MLEETVVVSVIETELEANGATIHSELSGIGIVFFVIDVCLVGPCAIVGIAGNITCLFVLRVCHRFRSTMYLLRALAMANTLLLLTNFFVRTLVQIGQNTDLLGEYTSWYNKTMWFWHPVPDMFHMAAVYYILLVAVDRYLLVYYPVLGERLCRPSLVICYIVSVTIIAIVCFIPKFFDLGGFAFPNANGTNGTVDAMRKHGALPPAAGARIDVQDSAPKIAYDAFDCFIQSILPTFCTAFFNLLLIKALRKVISNKEGTEDGVVINGNNLVAKQPAEPQQEQQQQQQQQSQPQQQQLQVPQAQLVLTERHNRHRIGYHPSHQSHHSRSQRKRQSRLRRIREDRSIMVMLVLVVSVSIMCELPMTVASFMKILDRHGSLNSGARSSYYILVQVATFFENFNACVNFFLYCVSYASFRRTLKSCLCNCVCY